MAEHRLPEDLLAEFHGAFGEKAFIERDAEGRRRLLDLRMDLITEEYEEVMDELCLVLSGHGQYQNLAKELADLMVVVVGTAQLMDIPFSEVFAEVMRSNMSKVGPDGVVLRRDDGKVLKPATYSPADLTFLDGLSKAA